MSLGGRDATERIRVMNMRTITLKEIIERNVSTCSRKNNSPRGIEVVPTGELKVGDEVVIDNYFTLIIE